MHLLTKLCTLFHQILLMFTFMAGMMVAPYPVVKVERISQDVVDPNDEIEHDDDFHNSVDSVDYLTGNYGGVEEFPDLPLENISETKPHLPDLPIRYKLSPILNTSLQFYIHNGTGTSCAALGIVNQQFLVKIFY